MKKRAGFSFAVVLGLLLFVVSAFAHHPFASLFDDQRVNKLKGVVAAFVWANPHTLIFLDTRNANGQVQHWVLEAPPPVNLVRMGLDKNSFKAGDTLDVCGYNTKDGVDPVRSFTPEEPISLSLRTIPRETSTGRLVFPATVTLPTGRKLVWASNLSGCLESADGTNAR